MTILTIPPAIAFLDNALNVFKNGWDFAVSHPIISAFVLIGLAATIGVLIGATISAHFLLGAAIGLTMGIAGLIAAGNIGKGGSGKSGAETGRPVSQDQQLKEVKSISIGPYENDSLSVNIKSTPPSPPEEWNRQNLASKIDIICRDLPTNRRTMDIEFNSVPAQLRRLILHHFAIHGVQVNEVVR